MSGICLKHHRQWRSRFQEFLNKISGPSRRNPLICEGDVKRITKAICTCATPHQAWNRLTEQAIRNAHTTYTQSNAFQTQSDGRNVSVHKDFYEKLQQNGAFGGNSSADRLVYILSSRVQQIGVLRDEVDILEQICPLPRRPVGECVHLGELRETNVGRFFGRGGTGIREAIHGIPVGSVNINVGEPNPATGTCRISATFNCRPRHHAQVSEGLRTRLSYYLGDEPVALRLRTQGRFGIFNRGRTDVQYGPGGVQVIPGSHDSGQPSVSIGYAAGGSSQRSEQAMDTEPSHPESKPGGSKKSKKK